MKNTFRLQKLISKALISLPFLCWCCLFTLPAINALGAIDGHWVSLCTTKGVQVILMQDFDNTSDSNKHHSNDNCPCVQHALHANHISLPPALAADYFSYASLSIESKEHPSFPTLLPRAPPLPHTYYHS